MGTSASSRPRGARHEHEVLAFARAFDPGHKAGGPIRAMDHVLTAVGDDVRIMLVTRDRESGDPAPYRGLSGRLVRRGRHTVFYWNRADPRQALRLLRLIRRASSFDLLYLNSFWDPWFSLAPLAAVRLRVIATGQVLLAPRGELAEAALAHKARKKRAAMPLVAALVTRVPLRWQVSSEHEMLDIRRFFPRARIIERVDSTGPDPVATVRASGEVARFVFLSRISPIKNLALAIDAVKALGEPAFFDLYGPISDPAYWRACQSAILELPAEVVVTYRGELPYDAVQRTFADYDAFVLPSYGESFGHAIAESLSAGCPVLCSERTLWTDLLRTGGGAALPDLETRTWTAELRRIAAQSASERERGKRDALAAYRRWRAAVDGSTAVDVALQVS